MLRFIQIAPNDRRAIHRRERRTAFLDYYSLRRPGCSQALDDPGTGRQRLLTVEVAQKHDPTNTTNRVAAGGSWNLVCFIARLRADQAKGIEIRGRSCEAAHLEKVSMPGRSSN